MTTLADRIRELRLSQGLTILALAIKCGMPEKTIWNIENDRVGPQYGTLEKIAAALGVKVEDLVKEKVEA